MRAGWVFMILLSCRFSHATESQSICTCQERLKIMCVPPGGDVLVPCPELSAEAAAFYLLKEDEIIYNHTCKNAPKCEPPHTRAGVTLHKNDNKSVSFMLNGVNASSYGIYRCEGTVIFPPPFVKVPSTLSILVRAEGHQCKIKNNYNETPKTDGEQKEGFLWIWIVGIVVLGIYGLIVTIIAGIIWAKWRSSDDHSDYINTKPKASWDRKKRRGVQIPIPRHF